MARKGNQDRGIFPDPKHRRDERGRLLHWIEYHDAGGHRHRELVGTKSQARAAYAKRKTDVREGRWAPPGRHRRSLTITDIVEQYLAVSQANRSRKTDLWHGEMLVGAFGDRLVDELSAGDIERWMAARAAETSPTTANRTFDFLKRACRRALRDELVATDPTARVKRFHEPRGRVRYLTAEEEAALRTTLPSTTWALVEFAIHTGLRRAEQFNLRWDSIDFQVGVITIARSKSGETRHVKMNSRVRELLRELPSRLKSEWVWVNRRGAPLNANNFCARVFRPAVAAAGIRDFHWHDLRHTFASRMVMAGKSLVAVQQLLGHASIKMTMVYAHLAPEHLEDAVEALVAAPQIMPQVAPQISIATATRTAIGEKREVAEAHS